MSHNKTLTILAGYFYAVKDNGPYIRMKTEFSEGQREIVDTIFVKIDEAYLDNAANIYLAGLLDGYRTFKNFSLTKE